MYQQRHPFTTLPDQRTLLTWGSLLGMVALLIAMVSLWMGLFVALCIGWSLQQERLGNQSILWHSIPKVSRFVNAQWYSTPDECDEIRIHLQQHQHTWTTPALVQLGIVSAGLICVGFGFVWGALFCLIILPSLYLRTSQKSEVSDDINDSTTATTGLDITVTGLSSWDTVIHFLQSHQAILPATGTIILPNDEALQPFKPPQHFANWSMATDKSQA